ncbi:hypothetical protein [Glaciimonas soli]|uniref:Uncharacterized protein n=1 Tax=Glaciimonas soli TaxID=2590999 RepID=A0A843YSE1_9BURK|nr:hypothetical protein [Glaciimonas soli]MQR00634.1 hypothetical protein [Glaciimonas soli]
MGYFDGLTSKNFKKDKNGNTLFFPWGVLGKGRVLPDDAAETRVRGFVNRYLKISLPMIIGVTTIAGLKWSTPLLLFFGVWFYFGTKALVSDYPYSDENLTIKESYANSAASHNKLTLQIIFFCSVLFVLIGIFMAATAKSPQQIAIGCFSAVFFGTCGVAIGYMLKKKSASAGTR